MSIAGDAMAMAVRGYQLSLRAVIGGHCRFEPSCSHYAIAVLRSHGALHGAGLATKRILRCNPWNAGGYDPPPAPLHSSKGRTAP
jgi:hypothetical protein